MRCCGCEATVDQLPLIPVGNEIYLIKEDDIVHKRYVVGSRLEIGWSAYFCTNCESVRYYKIIEMINNE